MEDETDAGSGGEEKGMNDLVSHVFKELTVTLPVAVIMARVSYYEANCMFGTVCSTFGSDHSAAKTVFMSGSQSDCSKLKERLVLKQEVLQSACVRAASSMENETL